MMRRQTGRPHKAKIINVGSIAYEIVVPNIASTRSAGRIAANDSFTGRRFRQRQRCVNSIAPGRFWTKMTDAVFSNPDLYDSAVSVIRWGVPASLRS